MTLVQIEAAQINEHLRGITAVSDGSLEKCPLIFPVPCSRKRPRTQEEQPVRGRRIREEKMIKTFRN
jgi:hypothetical protein